jgi:hypothetical protein
MGLPDGKPYAVCNTRFPRFKLLPVNFHSCLSSLTPEISAQQLTADEISNFSHSLFSSCSIQL